MNKILMSMLLILTISQGKSITNFLTKIASKNVPNVTKAIKKSHLINKKLPKVKLKSKMPKDMVLIAQVAQKISNKGAFEAKLINHTNHPADLLMQYAKYGDDYLNTMKQFSKKVAKITPEAINKLKSKFPTMPKLNIKNGNFNDKFIVALRYTGKKGWQVSKELAKFAKEHPKTSIVGALYAWYSIDPQGFLEKKDEILNQVEEIIKASSKDATKLTLQSASGVADGVIETIKENVTPRNITVLIGLFILFILWKLRTYIKRFLKIKIENKLSSLENSKNTTNQDEEGLL